MRFMVLVKPQRAVQRYEAGAIPEREDIERMGRFNEELVRDGVLLALDGLAPTKNGARITFAGGKASVTDGPFAETKELVGGYWMVELSSKQEAIERFSRAPMDDGDVLEIRQVYELSDFAPEAPPEMIAEGERTRAQLGNKR